MSLMNATIAKTEWYPQKKLIIAKIKGDIDKVGVMRWEQSLSAQLDALEDNDKFKIMIDMIGFKPIDLDVHKRFRTIVPLTMARHGWKVGYVDLFEEEAGKIQYTATRGITCIAAVHAHHDTAKMELYDNRFGRENERYFTDSILAEKWIEGFQMI